MRKLTKYWILLSLCSLAVAFWLSTGLDTASLAASKRRVGISVPSQVAQIASEQAGAILEIPVNEGDACKVGDVICRQSSAMQELEVERLRALAESDLRLRRAESELEYLRIATTRARELAQKEITSESNLRAQELEHEMAKIRLEQARLDQAQAVNAWRQAEVRLAQRTVKSPITGVVTRLFKHPGETTEELAPVAEVVQLDPLWIEFEVTLLEGDLFTKDTEVLVSPAATPEDVRTARIVFVSLKANPSSHSFMVRAATANPKLDWKSGLKMAVRTKAEAEKSTEPNSVPPK
ncbi:MAG: efflux RND transporter periplasmic adaptor subunit [Planctomycetes bacterium]|nr:efflux RND transporter periplasmic adaptor subunit [Planctomycetota bacterium]